MVGLTRGQIVSDTFADIVLDKVLTRVLGRLTTEHLKKAVDNDMNLISVEQSPGITPGEHVKVKGTISRIVVLGGEVAKNRSSVDLNLRNVLKWLQKSKPDFFKEMATEKKNIIWLDRQIEIIREHFFR